MTRSPAEAAHALFEALAEMACADDQVDTDSLAQMHEASDR